jgi:hypothetical protein
MDSHKYIWYVEESTQMGMDQEESDTVVNGEQTSYQQQQLSLITNNFIHKGSRVRKTVKLPPVLLEGQAYFNFVNAIRSPATKKTVRDRLEEIHAAC